MDTNTVGTGTASYTGTGHFGKLGTKSIPVRDTSVTSVRHQYRYRTLRSANSVRYPHRYRAYRYRTEHTLAII